MNTFCFNPFPLLTTDRTLLRRLVAEDGTDIFKLRSDDRVNKFLGRPLTVSYNEAKLFIRDRNTDIDNNESLYWGIVLKEEFSPLIGTVCLWNFSEANNIAEIGYELKPEYQGKGLMQEVIKSVIDFGFHELKLETITACVHFRNTKSLQLLEKCNFKTNPIANNEEEFEDLIIYSIHNTIN